MEQPIHALYLSYLSQKDGASPKSAAYYKAMSHLSRLEAELTPQLEENGRRLFSDFCETWGSIERIVSEETFSEGFQIGAQMMLDIFGDKNRAK